MVPLSGAGQYGIVRENITKGKRRDPVFLNINDSQNKPPPETDKPPPETGKLSAANFTLKNYESKLDQLERLGKLHEQKVLTEEEFQEEKEKVLKQEIDD